MLTGRQAGRPTITAVGDGAEGHEDGEMNAAAQQTDWPCAMEREL